MTEEDFGSTGDLTRHDLALINEYLKIGVPVDRLAYTDSFEQLYSRMKETGDTRSKSEVFFRLLNLRKSGQLPRLRWSESA